MSVGFAKDLSQDYLNDKISSFQIGENVRAKLCKNQGCQGNDWTDAIELVGPYNVGSLSDGANDMISQIELYRYDPSQEKYVMIFGNARFELGFGGLFAPGRYDSDDIKAHHIDKAGYGQAASSLIVPEGVIATLFTGEYYTGTQLSI